MRSLWVYAYRIIPPLRSSRLEGLRALLKTDPAVRRGARTWSGRLVLERRATHILIVSDAPGRDYAINHLLDAELARLAAPFSVSPPVVVAESRLRGLYLA